MPPPVRCFSGPRSVRSQLAVSYLPKLFFPAVAQDVAKHGSAGGAASPKLWIPIHHDQIRIVAVLRWGACPVELGPSSRFPSQAGSIPLPYAEGDSAIRCIGKIHLQGYEICHRICSGDRFSAIRSGWWSRHRLHRLLIC